MYVVLVGGVLWLTVLKGWKRLVVLVPVLYLAVAIWESAMLPQPPSPATSSSARCWSA